jgi:integrase
MTDALGPVGREVGRSSAGEPPDRFCSCWRSAVTTRQAYAVLHPILATAVADDALPRNPSRITGAGQARSDERPLLDVDQVQHLSASMPENLRGIVDLAFWAHLRLGELLTLPIGDIDLDAGTVAVQRQAWRRTRAPWRAHRRRAASASSTSPRRASRP